MRTSTLFLLSSLMIVGCGGDDGATVTEEDTGSATETSTSDDTGATPTDTGTPADDTGTATGETGTETGGDTGSAGDTMMATDTPADTAGAATFTQVYAIFAAKCAPCHTTATAGNLDMKNKNTAHGELMKKAEGASCSAGGMTRVVPGNADNSLLVHKLTKMDADVCGDRMPQGRPPLTAAEIAQVRSWITAGALNN